MTTAELAVRTGTTKRTIRYYLAEGLLPPAGGTAARMDFGREHELRLRLIQHLQAAGVKLAAVKDLMRRYDLKEVEDLIVAFDRGEAPSLENVPVEIARSIPDPLHPLLDGARQEEREVGELWRRVRLADGVEIHIRNPVARRQWKAVSDLIEVATKRFGSAE